MPDCDEPNVQVAVDRSSAVDALAPRRTIETPSAARRSSTSDDAISPARSIDASDRTTSAWVDGVLVPKSNDSEPPERSSVRRDPVKTRVVLRSPAAASVTSPIAPDTAAIASLPSRVSEPALLSTDTVESAAARTLVTCIAPALTSETPPALACTSAT